MHDRFTWRVFVKAQVSGPTPKIADSKVWDRAEKFPSGSDTAGPETTLFVCSFYHYNLTPLYVHTFPCSLQWKRKKSTLMDERMSEIC